MFKCQIEFTTLLYDDDNDHYPVHDLVSKDDNDMIMMIFVFRSRNDCNTIEVVINSFCRLFHRRFISVFIVWISLRISIDLFLFFCVCFFVSSTIPAVKLKKDGAFDDNFVVVVAVFFQTSFQYDKVFIW